MVEKSQTAAVIPELSPNCLAPWHLRVGAFAVDVLPGLVVVVAMASVVLTVPLRSAWWLLCMAVGGVVILLLLVNRLLLPAVLGWSLGRALCGIAVVKRDGAAIGPWRLLLRDLTHQLDTAAVLVGWLWPLWDSRRCTFADKLLCTEVRCIQLGKRKRTIRRRVSVALLTATVVCLGGAAVNYVVVYSHDRAVDQTGAQIMIQGPKMVAQMLTYNPKTLRADFTHAQSLASDKYRRQLAVQQDVVEKGHPVINEYWPIAGAIQSVTPNRATMLLFMQGRRGAAPDQRYISATVRVNFAKDKHGHWLVDDLTVLTKPRPPGNGK